MERGRRGRGYWIVEQPNERPLIILDNVLTMLLPLTLIDCIAVTNRFRSFEDFYKIK